jgi:arylsulfatase A-like enzyme
MGEDSADFGLIRTLRSLAWSPLWAILGIALPLTFFAEFRSASMYLRYAELIPLYATEWLCLAAVGICVSAVLRIVGAAVGKVRGAPSENTASRVAFGMVVAAAVVIGIEAWVESFGHGFLGLKQWHILIVAAALVAGIEAYFEIFPSILGRLRALAFPISLIGALSLLSTAWIHFPAASVPRQTSEMHANGTARPNIVLISIDALAANHMTPYGYSRPTSPNIAALASRSMVFDRFYSASNFTTTSVSTILTGEMPWRHRALQLLGRPTRASVAQSLPLRLRSAGYTTAYFSSSPWAGASREGLADDFDHKYSGLEWETAPCFDRLADRFPYLCAAAANPFLSIVFKALVSTAAAARIIDFAGYADPATITAAAARYLKQPHDLPLFMWIHYLPPHDPYAAPEPWLGQFDHSTSARTRGTSHPQYLFRFASEPKGQAEVLAARYDESVKYVDFYVGQLISTVRETLGPNTAIVLTADHGESFSHGYGGHGGVMMYEDLIHIPLILSLPGAATEARRVPGLANQSDLAPTIAAIAGVAAAASWDGVSLLSTEYVNEQRKIFSTNFEQNRSCDRLTTGAVAVRNGDWKLTRFLGTPRYPGMPVLKTQLFDVAKDPGELVDVADDHPDVVASLSKAIDEQLARYGGSRGE